MRPKTFENQVQGFMESGRSREEAEHLVNQGYFSKGQELTKEDYPELFNVIKGMFKP